MFSSSHDVKTTFVCLCWLTNENFDRRSSIVKESIESLNNLNNQNCNLVIINNGGLQIKENQTINLTKNYYDIAVHFSAYWIAKQNHHKYFAYTYDDFVFFDNDFLIACEEFMDINSEVCCMRLPYYEYGNSYFNANVTSKSKNPDAVRHENGASNSKLYFEGPLEIKNKRFYKTNWYPNSRPMLWRTESFSEFISEIDLKKVPVMQPFERIIYNKADKLFNEKKFVSSFIDGGVCKTFSINTSERTFFQSNKLNPKNWDATFIDVTELKNEIDIIKNGKNDG